MNRYAPVLRQLDFRAVWASAVVSGLGDRVATIAMYLLIYKMTGRAVNLGLLAAAQIIPAIVLGPVSGLALDRYNRKGLMITSDLLGVLVALTLALAATPTQVYILAALLSCGRQLTGPARLAIVPDILPKEQLASANALLMITRNLVLMVGPALGGLIVAWQGAGLAFVVDAATFLASAVILAARPFGYVARQGGAPLASVAAAGGVDATLVVGEPVPPPASGEGLRARARRLLSDVQVGLAGVVARPGLRFAFVFFAALTFVTAMQQPLVVVFVEQVLRSGAISLGLVVSAAGLGGILGAVLGGAKVGERRPLLAVIALTAIDGSLLVVFALNHAVWLAVVLFAAFGAVGTVAQIALATFLQREAPDETRGRTFGWLGTCVGPLSLVSVFLGPLAAEALGVVLVLALSGLFELVVAGAGALALRRSAARGPEVAGEADGRRDP